MYLFGVAKLYEASNHLGNVIVTISDKKLGRVSNLVQTKAEYYEAIVKTASDYYPFGWQMPNRKLNTENYSFGFNGMESNKELNEGSYDFGARIYDGRVARWLSVDPLEEKYPSLTPYSFVANMPIRAIDPDGLKIKIVGGKKYRKWVLSILRNLAKNSSTGRKLLEDIINNDNYTLIIHQDPGEDIGLRYNVNGTPIPGRPDTRKNARLVLNTDAGATMSPYEAGGWLSLEGHPSITLGHELQHFTDFMNGVLNKRGKYGVFIDRHDPSRIEVDDYTGVEQTVINYIDSDELSAVDTENKIRSEMGYPLRYVYSGNYVLNMEIEEDQEFILSDGSKHKGPGLTKSDNPTDYALYAKNNVRLTNAELDDWFNQFKKTSDDNIYRGGFVTSGNKVISLGSDPGTTTLKRGNKENSGSSGGSRNNIKPYSSHGGCSDACGEVW